MDKVCPATILVSYASILDTAIAVYLVPFEVTCPAASSSARNVP